MLHNYLLVSFRNMMRNKTISLIHIAGFGLGIAAFLFAARTVIFEYSYDSFHRNPNNIYDIGFFMKGQNGEENRFISAGPALYHRIKEQLPEVAYVTRYFDQGDREPYCVMTYSDERGNKKTYNEQNARYVDEDFLMVFDFNMLKGKRESALSDASSIVITKSLARKYFGDEDPIGKVLQVMTGGPETRQTKFTYQVSGVLEDVPSNSFLQFEVLLPYRNFEDHYIQDVRNIWVWPGFFTFIRVAEPRLPQQLETKINQLVPPEAQSNALRVFGISFRFEVRNFSGLHFEDRYFDSGFSGISTGSKTYVLIIGLIGLTILIVASINYINLTTAKSLKRVKEIGIRKVIGASRTQLVRQFILDAFLVNFIGFLFGLTLLQLCRPFIEIWSGDHYTKLEWNATEILLCLLILGGNTILSGTLPSFFLTRIEPARALKGLSLRSSGGGLLRQGLVVFQFVVSVALIVFTYSVFRQVQHLRSKQKGFDADQRIVMNSIGTEDFDFSKFRSFKKSIQGNASIINVSAALSLPGFYLQEATIYSRSEFPEERIRLSQNVVDYDFVTTLGLTLAAGREFTEDRMTSEKVVMLNETAVKAMGFSSPEEAIEKIISFHWNGVTDYQKLKIIGVIKDFNSLSPGIPVQPEIFMFSNTAWPYGQYYYFIAQVALGQHQEAVAFIEKQWKQIFPDAPFQYTFQDQAFQKVFARDEKIQSIAGLSTFVAILIACMGLGGLVAFSMSQRIKEIGVRKTLGASVSQILVILSSGFIRLIAISILIAIPLAWYALNEFLKNYEYRIELSIWIFLIPCLVLLLIAVATMSFQTVKAANANPVEALKYE